MGCWLQCKWCVNTVYDHCKISLVKRQQGFTLVRYVTPLQFSCMQECISASTSSLHGPCNDVRFNTKYFIVVWREVVWNKSALCNVLMTSRKCYITMTSAQKFSTATMCLLPSHDDYSHVFRNYNLSMQEENKLRLFIGHNKLSSAFIQIHTHIYIY